MQLVLFSNSTNDGEEYFGFPLKYIPKHLKQGAKNVVFIPYAAVSISNDEYEARVNNKLQQIGFSCTGVHHATNKQVAIQQADVIMVGGGNTFHLLHKLQQLKLMDVIRQKVLGGTPYIGWSAGTNIACPTIKTTNDMPIIETADLNGLNLFPHQVNPHYTDQHPNSHAGETRDMRIEEFIKVNPGVYVIGLREGNYLHVNNGICILYGDNNAKIFNSNFNTPKIIEPLHELHLD